MKTQVVKNAGKASDLIVFENLPFPHVLVGRRQVPLTLQLLEKGSCINDAVAERNSANEYRLEACTPEASAADSRILVLIELEPDQLEGKVRCAKYSLEQTEVICADSFRRTVGSKSRQDEESKPGVPLETFNSLLVVMSPESTITVSYTDEAGTPWSDRWLIRLVDRRAYLYPREYWLREGRFTAKATIGATAARAESTSTATAPRDPTASPVSMDAFYR